MKSKIYCKLNIAQIACSKRVHNHDYKTKY
jgi:hypothetical protein